MRKYFNALVTTWANFSRCQCCHCDSRRRRIAGRLLGKHPILLGASRMYLCSECGNKRCPKATYHKHRCTASNKPGQTGSRY